MCGEHGGRVVARARAVMVAPDGSTVEEAARASGGSSAREDVRERGDETFDVGVAVRRGQRDAQA